MTPYRIKIIIALLLALGFSWLLNTQVFLLDTPLIRPDAPQRLAQMPKSLLESTGKIIAGFPKPQPRTPNNGNAIQPTGRPQTQPFPLPPADDSSPQPTIPNSGTVPSPTAQWITIVPPTLTPHPTQVPNAPSYTPRPPTPTQRPITKIEFAQCLTTKGFKFYSNAACPYCRQQKADFGTQAWSYISEVNCDQQAQVCRSKPGVAKGPAWESGSGQVWPGAMDFQSLGYVSQCPKPTI